MSATKRQTLHEIIQAQPVRSERGYAINKNDDVWELHGGKIDWSAFAKVATPEFVTNLKTIFETIVHNAQVTDATVVGYKSALLHLLRYAHEKGGAQVDDIDAAMLKRWLRDQETVIYPVVIKGFIARARAVSPDAFPDISEAVLKKIKPLSRDAEDVLTLDPERGPWLEAEVHAQDAALERAFTSGELHDEKYLLVQLIRQYGPRSDQLAHMKVGDVRLPNLHPDTLGPIVRFPWSKNSRSIDTSPWRPLFVDLAQAMERYLDERLKGIPKNQWDSLPLFTPEGLPGVWQNTNKKSKPSKEEGFEGHCMAHTIGFRFIRVMDSFELETMRTGEKKRMKFHPHRERHTIGTRLALEGLSAKEIAHMLLQSSEASSEAYVHLGIQYFQLMRCKLDPYAKHIAHHFVNPPVEKAELLSKTMDVIVSRDHEDIPMIGGGTCGSCQMRVDGSAPFACLSCNRFRVYIDADLQPLWDTIQDRKAYLYDENGELSPRFEYGQEQSFERLEAALISVAIAQDEARKKRDKLEG